MDLARWRRRRAHGAGALQRARARPARGEARPHRAVQRHEGHAVPATGAILNTYSSTHRVGRRHKWISGAFLLKLLLTWPHLLILRLTFYIFQITPFCLYILANVVFLFATLEVFLLRYFPEK